MSNKLTDEQRFRLFHYSELAKVIRALKERFGEEAYEIVAEQNGKQAFHQWKEIADKSDTNTINDLIKYLWEPLRKEGFDYDVEETELGIQMKCTRCGLYDLANHLGITEEAFYMFCASDPYITDGFNSNIGLKRTKTLMQGHDCCDHFYYLKNKDI